MTERDGFFAQTNEWMGGCGVWNLMFDDQIDGRNNGLLGVCCDRYMYASHLTNVYVNKLTDNRTLMRECVIQTDVNISGLTDKSIDSLKTHP